MIYRSSTSFKTHKISITLAFIINTLGLSIAGPVNEKGGCIKNQFSKKNFADPVGSQNIVMRKEKGRRVGRDACKKGDAWVAKYIATRPIKVARAFPYLNTVRARSSLRQTRRGERYSYGYVRIHVSCKGQNTAIVKTVLFFFRPFWYKESEHIDTSY